MDMPKRPDNEPKMSDSNNVDPSEEIYSMKSLAENRVITSYEERLTKMTHAVEVLLDVSACVTCALTAREVFVSLFSCIHGNCL